MGSDKSRKSGTMKISDLVGEIQSVALSSLAIKMFFLHISIFSKKNTTVYKVMWCTHQKYGTHQKKSLFHVLAS